MCVLVVAYIDLDPMNSQIRLAMGSGLHWEDEVDTEKAWEMCLVMNLKMKTFFLFLTYRYFNCSSPGVQACSVPASCCLNPLENGTILNSQCGFGTLGMEEFAVQSTIYLGGCVPQLSRWLNSHAGTIGFCALVMIVIEVSSLFLAIKLLAGIASAWAQHYHGRKGMH